MLSSAWQLVSNGFKTIVGIGAVALVVWSFYWVATRPWRAAALGENSIELVVMNWSGGGGRQEEEIVANLIARFEAEHPDIRIKRINPGDSGSFNTKLQTMMAANVAPDVFYMGGERFANFAASGRLMEIEPLIRADEAAGRDTLDLDDFYQNTLDSFRFDGETTGSGALYGVPKDFTTWGFYYNKDLFDAAGLTYPNDLPVESWTWETFARYARRLAELPGVLGGAEFSVWDDPVRAYLWSYGVDVVDDEFNSRLFEPEVYGRLKQLYDWRFSEPWRQLQPDGTSINTLVSGDSQVAQGQDIFVTGRVGMVGPLGRWVAPIYRDITAFEWDFAAMPMGTERANLVATVAWSINARTEHPEAAWQLVKFLTGESGQRRIAELGLAIPTLKSVANSAAFSDPTVPPEHDNVYLEQAEYARVAKIPGYPEWKAALSRRFEQFLRSGDPMEQTLRALEQEWESDRANPLRSGTFPALRWDWVLVLVLAPVTALGAFGLWRWRAGRPGVIAQREELSGYAMISPWLLGFAAFMAFPIVMSLILSFARWTGYTTLAEAEWVGGANYATLFGSDGRFWNSLWVTAYYALFAVPIGQMIALALALLLNHDLKLSGFFRSALYLPSVLAGVGVAILWRWVFDGEVGLLNTYLLDPVLDPLGVESPRWFTADARTFGPPAFAIMSFWALGGTMVIYLAGLKGIPVELYEAAAIDGSSLWQRFRNITLPMLSPVIFFNGIMAISPRSRCLRRRL